MEGILEYGVIVKVVKLVREGKVLESEAYGNVMNINFFFLQRCRKRALTSDLQSRLKQNLVGHHD